MNEPTVIPQRLVYSLNEAAKQLNIGRNTLGELLHAGTIRGNKTGQRWFISHQVCLEYLGEQEGRIGPVLAVEATRAITVEPVAVWIAGKIDLYIGCILLDKCLIKRRRCFSSAPGI